MPASQSGKAQSSNGHIGNSQSSGGSIGGSSSGHPGSVGSTGSAQSGRVNTGIGGSSSIPSPALQHRFTIRVEATPKSFNDQCIALAMNMVAKELVMIVEQSLTNTDREHVVIQNLIDSPGRQVTLEITNGNGAVIDTMKFRDCTVINHTVEFNYASSGVVAHVVNLSYTKVDLVGGGKAHAAFNNAMSIVGRP